MTYGNNSPEMCLYDEIRRNACCRRLDCQRSSLHEHDGVERGFAPRWSGVVYRTDVIGTMLYMYVSFSGLGGSFVVPYPVYREAGDR